MGTFLDAIILTVFIVISHKLLVGRERHPCARTRTHIHTHTPLMIKHHYEILADSPICKSTCIFLSRESRMFGNYLGLLHV